MVKKTIKQLEEEIKKLIKVNNSNFVEHQKNEHELRDTIRNKDKEILKLKRILENTKNPTEAKSNDGLNLLEELDAFRFLKVEQARKISILTEENSALIDQVEQLKFEAETDKAIVGKLYTKIDDLKSKVEEMVHEKQNVANEYDKKLNENFKKVENLETKVQILNKNKLEKANLLKKMENLSLLRKEEFEKLKASVCQLKKSEVIDCRFGHECMRRFCIYSHRYLFVKDNRAVIYSCEFCEEKFANKTHLEDHRKNEHCVENYNDVMLIETNLTRELTRVTNEHRINTSNNYDNEKTDDESDDSGDSSAFLDSDVSFDDSSSNDSSETESGEDSSD